MFIHRNNDENERLKEQLAEKLSDDGIPVEEIITPDILFTDRLIEFNRVYIYVRKGKYYMKVVTFRKSEEELHEFTDIDELEYRLVELQMTRKAFREKGNFKELYFCYMKQIGESYYERAADEWNRTHL